MRRLWRLYEKEEKARDRSVTDGSDNKKRRKGGRALYYYVESVACLFFTIVLIVATRAIIYLLAFHLPQKMLPPFVFAAFLFSIVPLKGEGDILKVRDDISTLN